jgi:hypothetical protein
MTGDGGNSDGLRKKHLYRLPWSLNDNPIGWVEITDLCNISCRGCYRSTLAGHKSFADIQNEILFLQEWRNITNVHLAGGEPLIHPDIVEIVRFIHDRRLNPVIITNGHRLTRELLIRLRDAGLGELSFHIDSGQTRPGWTGKNEVELNALRQHYAELLWDVGGVTCNFNMTVNPSTIATVPEVIRWALGTRGKVNGLTLITLRGFPRQGVKFVEGDKVIDLDAPAIGMVNDVEDELSNLRSNELYRVIRSAYPGYEAATYLGGTKTMSSFKWLIANVICCNGEVLGSVSPATVEIAQTFHHLRYGKYYAGGRGRVGKAILLMAVVDRRIRRVLTSLLRRPGRLFGKICTFTVSIIEPNTLLPDGEVEMCDSCPDMTYHEGRLVNSCRLDEYRMYGNLVKPVITAD